MLSLTTSEGAEIPPSSPFASYSPEETGRLLADYLRSQSRLRRRLSHLPTLVDLDTAIRPLSPRLKHIVRRFITTAHTPSFEFTSFPTPLELESAIAALEEEERSKEARVLRATLRDIRVLQQITVRLNTGNRRRRDPILVTADHRHSHYLCRNCKDRIEFGEQILWDQDRGGCWHAVCSYLDSLPPTP